MTDISHLRAKLMDAQQKFEDMDDDAGVLLTECCAEMLTLLESPAAPQVAGGEMANMQSANDRMSKHILALDVPGMLTEKGAALMRTFWQTWNEDSAATPAAPCANADLPCIDIVFDGPPGPIAGRFVEVEDGHGKSISIGEWIARPDGLHALRISLAETKAVEGKARELLSEWSTFWSCAREEISHERTFVAGETLDARTNDVLEPGK